MKNKLELTSLSSARLWFDDDHHRMGCGMRLCSVKVGRKYVHITDRANGTKIKMTIKQAFPIIMGSLKRSKQYDTGGIVQTRTKGRKGDIRRAR
jgi:MinD superfamily P-loop ATPase